MSVLKRLTGLSLILFFFGDFSPAQEIPEAQQIANWPSPLLWVPTEVRAPGEARTEAANTASAPLPLIAISPCRAVDTRGNGAPIQGGIFTGGSDVRSYILAGICGIPVSARAVSLNFTVTGPGQTTPGFLLAWPSDGPVPAVSILNWDHVPAQIANAAVVPTSSTVSITVNVSAPTHVIVDVNGYYDNSGLITGVTAGTGLAGGGTSGTVSLGIAAGGVASTQLASASVTSAKIAANAVTAGAIASGQVAKNVNGVTDSVTVAGSGGASVSTVGSTITVGVPGFVPAGTFVLGNSGDTTLIGAGYTELGPSTQDAWAPTATTGAPLARSNATAVWTGTRMIVWGGNNVGIPLNSGGRYDPVADAWLATTTAGANPASRDQHTAVWTGTRMIIWGGNDQGSVFNTGGQYDPVGNSWTATTTAGATPAARRLHSAVWTGTRMIVWGGFNGVDLNTGGQYDPAGDSWTATTTTNAPVARSGHSAVWTGSRMIVWGGGNLLNTGGLYDPVGNSWTVGGTATTGAPTGRVSQTAIWTGTRMIIWGGQDAGGVTNTGGQYDPVGNSWTSTTTAGAPTVRRSHTAVWTTSKMVVWGGFDGSSLGTGGGTGGQYDPLVNAWTPTTVTGAPLVRFAHVAVWTGTTMIVWGGQAGPGGAPTNTGGRWKLLSLYLKN